MVVNAKTHNQSGQAEATEQRTVEETARLGREIYERDIRHLVESDHVGKIVSIDVDTGIWVMDDEQYDACERLLKKRPEAINVFSECVGYRTVGSIGGGGMLRRTD